MKALVTALAVIAAPTIVTAATISPGSNFGTSFQLTEGGYVSYSFIADEALRVSEIAVAGTGFSNAGLDSIAFGIVGSDLSYGFDMIEAGSDPDTPRSASSTASPQTLGKPSRFISPRMLA